VPTKAYNAIERIKQVYVPFRRIYDILIEELKGINILKETIL
jgi:hypothetical protein